MSIVGRDGVTVNVSTGKADSRVVPQSSMMERGNGYGSGLPPVKHVSIKPPSPAVGQLVRQPPQQQYQPPQPLQQHVILRSPDSSPSPNLMTESEWLKKTAAVTQQQLLILQQQLGVPQATAVNIPRSETPNSERLPPTSSTPPLPSHQMVPSSGLNVKNGSKVGYGRRQQGYPSSLTQQQQQQQPQPPLSPPNNRKDRNDTNIQPRYGRRSQSTGVKQPEQQLPEPPKQPSYKPYTLADYQRVNQPVKLGGLGPEDSEEKQFLRIQKGMARKYAAEVKATNQAQMNKGSGRPPPIGKQPTQQQRAAAERRAKALEFAAKVPKPKIAANSPPVKEPIHIPTKAEIELQNLEDQHSRDIVCCCYHFGVMHCEISF